MPGCSRQAFDTVKHMQWSFIIVAYSYFLSWETPSSIHNSKRSEAPLYLYNSGNDFSLLPEEKHEVYTVWLQEIRRIVVEY